jgi:hypothetical protein
MARVAAVARAWRELQMTMERGGAATVSDVERAELVRLAPALWVVMPGSAAQP